MRIDVFDYPTVVWRPLSREPLRISAQTLCRQNLDSVTYIFAIDSMGLSSFIFLWWAPKDASILEQNAYWPFKVIQGRWFWHQSKGRMRLPISQSLIVTLVLSCTVSEIWRVIGWKLWIFPTPPSFDVPVQGNPFEFLDETYQAKTRGMGLLYSENCTILTTTVFAWITRVTDGQTDGQMDGIAIAYARNSIYAVACKN